MLALPMPSLNIYLCIPLISLGKGCGGRGSKEVMSVDVSMAARC